MIKSKNNKKLKKITRNSCEISRKEAFKRLVIIVLLIFAILIPFSSYQVAHKYDLIAINTQWESFIRVGDAYMSRGQFIDAMTYYDVAHNFAEKIEDREKKAISLNKIGKANYIYGNYEEGLSNLNKALDIYNKNKIKNEYFLSSIYRNLGNNYEYTAKGYDVVKETYEKALFFATSPKNVNYEVVIDILTNSGIRDYEKSLEYLVKYLEIARTKRDTILGIRLLTDLSTSYLFSSQKQKAEEYALKAKYAVDVLLTGQDISKVSCKIGSALYHLDKCDEALPILNKGLEDAINDKNKLTQSSNLTVIGYCQEKNKDYEEAIKTIEKNLELHKEMYRPDHHYIKFFENRLNFVKEKINAK